MMSRELKFRSWDGQMISYDVTLWINPIHKTAIAWDCMRDCKIEGLEIMQYTGLKDKNWVEIYEGDIVTLVEAKRNYTVEYIDYAFKLVHANPNMHRMHWGSISRIIENDFTIDIIGNIYEYKHLLL